MTAEFAIQYIAHRMRELGYGKDYLIRWRNFQIAPSETLTIETGNDYYFLLHNTTSLIIKSRFGEFNLNDTALNELQYEHRGRLQIVNPVALNQYVQFIQAIPTHRSKTNTP